MVVVHMAGHHDINGFHSILRLELRNGMLNETHSIVNGGSILVDAKAIPACRAVIHEERFAAVTDQGIKTRSGVYGSHEMGRNCDWFAIHRKEPAPVCRIPTFELRNCAQITCTDRKSVV